MLRARGSFYKSIKNASTSSLDLLGTLATSISRENLALYGANCDSANALNGLGSGGALKEESSSSSSMKGNSESIPNFWMLEDVGDLSRPDHEDLVMDGVTGGVNEVISSVFDNDEEDEGNDNLFSETGKDTALSSRIGRSESAPSFSNLVNITNTTSTSSSPPRSTDRDEEINKSLLEMASSEHSRIDKLHDEK